MNSITKQILTKIKNKPKGWVFTAADFSGLRTTPEAVRQALSRLCRKGEISRIRHGIYERPRVHPVLGKLPPHLAEVARAIARRDGFKLQVSGSAAANELGLSTQVPGRLVYLTPGPSHTIEISGRAIEFRHVHPRRFSVGPGTLAGSTFHALLHLGPRGLSQQNIERLRSRLPEEAKRCLERNASAGPSWAREPINQICVSEPLPDAA